MAILRFSILRARTRASRPVNEAIDEPSQWPGTQPKIRVVRTPVSFDGTTSNPRAQPPQHQRTRAGVAPSASLRLPLSTAATPASQWPHSIERRSIGRPP